MSGLKRRIRFDDPAIEKEFDTIVTFINKYVEVPEINRTIGNKTYKPYHTGGVNTGNTPPIIPIPIPDPGLPKPIDPISKSYAEQYSSNSASNSIYIGKSFNKDSVNSGTHEVGMIPANYFLKSIYFIIETEFDNVVTLELKDGLGNTLLYDEDVDITVQGINEKLYMKKYYNNSGVYIDFDGTATKGLGHLILEVVKVEGL